VLWNLGAFFVLLLLTTFARGFGNELIGLAALDPYAVLHHGWIWQIVTYSAVHLGIFGTLFELMSIWSLGSFLESNHGSRWLFEIFSRWRCFCPPRRFLCMPPGAASLAC
jgi:membrane associated rhomboid family serine protease